MPIDAAYAQIQDFGDCMVDGVPTLGCLETVVSNIIFVSSSFAILVLFIMLIVGAFRFATTGGSADKIKAAKNTLTYAFIGLLFFVGAYLIINTLDILFLGGQGKLFRFEIPSN